MIGPKQVFLIPLGLYQNHEDQSVQCLDDFEVKSKSKEEFSTTHINQTQYSNKKLGKNHNKVKFNPNVIRYNFFKNEPAIVISRQIKKLILQQPSLKWINPTLEHEIKMILFNFHSPQIKIIQNFIPLMYFTKNSSSFIVENGIYKSLQLAFL
ncbi:unnamed protein product (macronuclear) [Paramecium tetraurelia]|uniref:Uncharacterized protein n=1 Tax=Paramecium tetraurelia TaxID=5888 RepID=A0BVX0_PARTE|nr:uncharacterized protein GSPATT00032539001 [Paramecium tetraurelia]CAK62687.1 unnamed protein product [Paramecium tetraurelia]|eukprot:XP_001430085.1 hypothetical protein (macronuclear) [Paramecium tetraurelia strain d4-2]